MCSQLATPLSISLVFFVYCMRDCFVYWVRQGFLFIKKTVVIVKKIVSLVQMCLSNRELNVGPFLFEGGFGTRQCSVEGVGGTGMNLGSSGHHTRCWHDLVRCLGLNRPIISKGPFHAAPSVVCLKRVWSLACLFKRGSDLKMQMGIDYPNKGGKYERFWFGTDSMYPQTWSCVLKEMLWKSRDFGSYFHFPLLVCSRYGEHHMPKHRVGPILWTIQVGHKTTSDRAPIVGLALIWMNWIIRPTCIHFGW